MCAVPADVLDAGLGLDRSIQIGLTAALLLPS